MAKILVLILSLFFTAQAFLNIPDDTMKQIEIECSSQNGLDFDTVQQYLNKQIPYSDTFGPCALCVAKATGVFNDESEYMRDLVLQNLQADGKDSDEANLLADQCNIQKDSSGASADATLMCLSKNDP